MKLGVLTALDAERPLEEVLDRVAGLGLDAVELGTGNHPGSSHCDPELLLGDPAAAGRLRRSVEERGLLISPLSCHGKPLHPDEAVAGAHHETWRRTLELAAALEVGVVNTFSGCPGDGAGSRCPNWITCPWPPEYAETLARQWEEWAIPYWREEAARAAELGIRVGIEMHPGFLVYNPEKLLRLRAAAGDAIGTNFDPSHLFWQGNRRCRGDQGARRRRRDPPRAREGHARGRAERPAQRGARHEAVRASARARLDVPHGGLRPRRGGLAGDRLRTTPRRGTTACSASSTRTSSPRATKGSSGPRRCSSG